MRALSSAALSLSAAAMAADPPASWPMRKIQSKSFSPE